MQDLACYTKFSNFENANSMLDTNFFVMVSAVVVKKTVSGALNDFFVNTRGERVGSNLIDIFLKML